MTGEIKVVTTEQLLRAVVSARRQELTLTMDDLVVNRLDNLSHHSLGRLVTDRGDRCHNGLPYYRVRALLALTGCLEPVERVIDVPVNEWTIWPDGETVISQLKAAIQSLGDEMSREARWAR